MSTNYGTTDERGLLMLNMYSTLTGGPTDVTTFDADGVRLLASDAMTDILRYIDQETEADADETIESASLCFEAEREPKE